MAFSFQDVLTHMEQTLINSIEELKRNQTEIRPETALYLFGLSLSSFFQDNVSDIDITNKQIQARLFNSLKLGWKDGVLNTQQPSAEIPPEQPGGMQVPGGAPAGPDQLGNLPMPGSTPPPSQPPGGEPPDLDNLDEEPPAPIKKETLDFKKLQKKGFLNKRKFTGIQLYS